MSICLSFGKIGKDYPTDEWLANYLTVDGGAMLYKEVNVTHIPDGLESEYEWNSIDIEKLREKYPEYFELGTFKGLEVYVWQIAENDYRFGLMQGTNRNKTLIHGRILFPVIWLQMIWRKTQNTWTIYEVC